MNIYTILPIAAFFVNAILGLYIIYIYPKNTLNRLYALFSLSVAIWSIATFFTFTSPTLDTALNWNKVALLGSLLILAFLLHFFLIFVKSGLAKKKFIALLYLPALIIIFVAFTTNLIYESASPVYWGYNFVTGPLYPLFLFYLIGYSITGLWVCYGFYQRALGFQKIQAKLLIIALLIALAGGVLTEGIPKYAGFDIYPLSTGVVSITAAIIAYTMVKYRLFYPVAFSIQKKLILSFLLVITPLIIVGFFFIGKNQEAIKTSIGEETAALAREKIDSIDKDIYTRIEHTQAYSKSSVIEQRLLKSNKQFDEMDDVQEYIKGRDKEWLSLPKETITPFMQKLINNPLSKELREKFELKEFYEDKYGYKVFGEVFITNKYGANVAQTIKTTDYYQADEEWWQVAKKKGLYIRDVEYDESADVYSTDIGIRIDDDKGSFLGVLKAVLNIEEVVALMKSIDLSLERLESQAIHIKLVTKDGKVIYSTGQTKILQDLSNEEFMIRALEDKGGYFIAEGDEPEIEEELFAYAHSKGFRDYEGLGWIMIVEHDTEELFAPAVNMRNNMLTVGVGTLLFSLLIAVFISRSITKPLRRLTQAASEISEGKFDVWRDVDATTSGTKDETSELSEAFKLMAENLKEARRNLEGKIYRLTELDKIKDDFLNITAHELKTPLTSIVGLSKIVKNQKSSLSPEQKNYLEIIHKEGVNLSLIMRRILTVTRFESGKEAVSYEIVNLSTFLTSLIPTLNILAKKTNSKVVAKIDKNDLVVKTDKEKISEVINNFVDNALKYGPKGQTITIVAKKENNHVKIEVVDQGMGISKAQQNKLFDKFSQLEPSISRSREGIGLGLYICKLIVDKLGGRIGVESRLSKGSTFYFTLPLQK